MMNCNKTEDQLIGYLLNTLSREDLEGLEDHLSSCRNCQRRLEELKKAKRLFGRWKDVTPPPDLKQKVLDNLRAQKLIEEKIFQKRIPAKFSIDEITGWLRKRVNSEQIRIYKVLTDFLGQEKGEEVFDYYLQEDLKDKLSTPPQIISQSLGVEIERTKLEEGITRETVWNCSFISIAEELGMRISPCEAICRRQIELMQKLYAVKIERIKKLPNQEGVCVFLFRSL
jgi:hypothetical protein